MPWNVLICSLHHVEFARAYFPRIVGLREGCIMFDKRREEVTDAMVAALYQNEQDDRTRMPESGFANEPHGF